MNGYTNTCVCQTAIFQPVKIAKTDKKIRFESDLRQDSYDRIYNWLGLNHNYDRTGTLLHNIDLTHRLTNKNMRFRMKERMKNKGTSEPRYDSVKRAKDSIFDYALNNEWEYFFTVTFNPDQVDSFSPIDVLRKTQNWLKNQVKRKGLKYIMVSEYHESGRIHFHGFLSCEKDLGFVYSGTKKYKRFKRPVSDEKAFKMQLTEGKPVYNIPSWKFGWTTAIKCYGDPLAYTFYITKYITKDSKKIFGRFFWHSKNISKPMITYEDIDFYTFDSLNFNGYKYKFERNE